MSRKPIDSQITYRQRLAEAGKVVRVLPRRLKRVLAPLEVEPTTIEESLEQTLEPLKTAAESTITFLPGNPLKIEDLTPDEFSLKPIAPNKPVEAAPPPMSRSRNASRGPSQGPGASQK
jgi:hypothetical protein